MEECLICHDQKPVHALLACLHTVCFSCADDALKICDQQQLPNFVCPLCTEPSSLSALKNGVHPAPATSDPLTHEGALLLYENQERLTFELSKMEPLICELEVLMNDLTLEQIKLANTVGGHFDSVQDNADARSLYDNLLQAGVFYYHTDIKVTQIQHDEAISLRTRLRRCLDLVNAALVDAPPKKDILDIFVKLYPSAHHPGKSVYSEQIQRLDAWASELMVLAHKDVKKPLVTRAHVYVGPRVVNVDNMQFCSITSEFRHRKAPVQFSPGQRIKKPDVVRHYEHGLIYFCEQLTDDTFVVSDEANGVVIYSISGQPPRYLDTPKARRFCDVQICELGIIWVLSDDARTHWGNALRRFSKTGELLEDARLNGYAGCCNEFKLLPGGFILVATSPRTPGDFTRVVRLFNVNEEELWTHTVEPTATTVDEMLKPFLRDFCSSSIMPFLRDGIIMRDMHDYGTCSTQDESRERCWQLPFRDATMNCDGDSLVLQKSSHTFRCYESVIRQQPPVSEENSVAIRDLSGGRYIIIRPRYSGVSGPYRSATDVATEIKILDI